MTLRAYLKEIFAPEEIIVSANEIKQLDIDNRAEEISPKVRLASVKTAPTLEAFEAWRDHPVTQFVFAAHRQIAGECRANWERDSWEGGIADQKALDEYRVRADTYNALPDADYSAYCATLGLEPRGED